jgi:hypothetical protein
MPLFPHVLWGSFLVVAPLVALGYQYRSVLPPVVRFLYGCFLTVIVAVLLQYAVQQALISVAHPREWDMTAFWLYGSIAAQGENYYDPVAYHREADTLDLDPEFVREVTNVGFPYPPPSILLYAPLGLLDLPGAARSWYLLNTLALLAACLALWRLLFPGSGMLGLGVVAALVLGFASSQATIALAQTNFLVLLFVVLFAAARQRAVGGLFLAAGVLVKPVVAIIALYPAIRRQWKTLVVAATAYLVLWAGTIALFGWPAIRSYSTDGPLKRLPAALYTAGNNQALLRFILRWRNGGELPLSPPEGALWADGYFIAASLTLLAATLVLVWRLGVSPHSQAGELGLALLVPVALLLYPQSLTHYTVLLILPVLFLWSQARALGLSPLFAIGIMSFVYWILLLRSGELSVLATGLVWLALGFAGALIVWRGRTTPPTAQPLA